MSLYIHDPDNKVGELKISSGELFFLKIGDRINIRTVALGLKEGYQDFFNVEVCSIYSEGRSGALGSPGGKVRFDYRGGVYGFSGNAVLQLEVL